MRWFHRHGPWDMVSAHCDGRHHFVGTIGRFSLLTEIALKCRECGTLKFKTVYGYHTLEQLNTNNEVAKALMYLEK